MTTSNMLTKGMNQDIHPKYQPEGSYRMALNAVLETREGDIATLSNELGNIESSSGYPSTKKIIGHRLLDDGTTVVFLFDSATSRPDHEIGIFDPKQYSYTTYKKGSCLNFSAAHNINAIYRLKNGCERIVYFTDNYNPYRYINLDRPEYYGPGTSFTSCDKLKYSRDYKIMDVVASINNSGGNTDVGTYNFVFRYLDQDENPTDWIFTTKSISIVDESENTINPNSYDGGVSNPDEVGYVPKTSKSIALDLSSVDTRFSFIQVAVIKYTASSGAVSGVDILQAEPIPPSSSPTTTLSTVYTGFDSQVVNQTSIDDILTSRQRLYKVLTHEQKDGRLFVANTIDERKDYTGFQRHASSIKTEWAETEEDYNSKVSKDPQYYFIDGSFMRDEIYALGIVYIFSDGTLSPVFHIPGRPMIDNTDNDYGTNPYISTDIDQWDSIDVTGDENVFNPDKSTRWQVYNTYTVNEDEDSGLMGYYQVSTTYPDIDVCDDDHADGYWGRDWTDTLIEPGDPIRHHRMPYHAKGLTNPEVTRLGIKFTVAENYPSSDIVGHYYVYGDRTSEKTILDKGITAPIAQGILLFDGTEGLIHSPKRRTQDAENTYGYFSADTLFNDKKIAGNYITVEKVFDEDSSTEGWGPAPDGPDPDAWANNLYGEPINIATIQYILKTWVNPTRLNYTIEEVLSLAKSLEGLIPVTAYSETLGETIQNNSSNISIAILTLNGALETFSSDEDDYLKYHLLSIKSDVEVFRNLYNISYIRIDNSKHTKVNNVDSEDIVYGGDIFVSNNLVVDYSWSGVPEGDQLTAWAMYTSYYADNSFNVGMRHDSMEEGQKYTYFKASNNFDRNSFGQYVANKYYEPVEGVPSFYPETYLYNKAYSNLDSIIRYIPIPFNYDHCSDCLDTYPYRIYYSNADDIERRKDAYLFILPNNYKDIDGNSGPITDLFINFNDVYANTPYTPYIIPTNQQALLTEDASIVIGSSAVLPVAPKPLKNSDIGYGGTSFWKSRVSSEHGTIWVDDASGRVMLLGKGLEDITLKGLRNFFQENGKVKWLQQFKDLTGEDYPNVALSSSLGVGYTSVYDPRHKRVIIHKRDYKLRPEYNFYYTPGSTPSVDPGEIWFDGTNFYYQRTELTSNVISFADSDFFENKSFTLSYSFLTESWVSFHSYMPYYMFNDVEYFYTDNIRRHNVGDYQTYNDTKYDHIVDLIVVQNPQEIKISDNISYSSDVSEFSYDLTHSFNLPLTFDRIIAYNSHQSTGLQPLIVKNDPFSVDTPSSVYTRRTDNKWRLNDLRDYSTANNSIWSSSWPDIQSSPFNWIDKVPSNTDTTKSLFEANRLRDYYLGVRLFFNPTKNVKISTDLINTTYSNRNR